MSRSLRIGLCPALLLIVSGSAALAEEARGLLRAAREAVLAAPLAARIADVPVREGDRVAAGDVVVAFACDGRHADARVAEAETRASDLAHQIAMALHKRGAAGTFDVDVARAKLDRSRAAEEQLVSRLADCRVTAPFAGRIADLRARRHETPAQGAPLLRLLGDGELEFDLIVSASTLASLKPGQTFPLRIDDAGETVEAALRVLPASVDPVSQTARVTGRLLAPSNRGLPGMGVTALLPGAGG